VFGFLGLREGVAVRHQRGSLTFGELNNLLGRACARLDGLGLTPGDRVATVLPNSLDLLVGYYACLLKGLVVTPINARLALAEIQAILRHSTPRCLITTEANTRRARSWLDVGDGREAEVTPHVLTPEWLGHGGDQAAPGTGLPPEPRWPLDHPAVLFYTSGSTGLPKGVLYSHGTLVGNCRVYGDGLGISASDHSVLCHCMSTNFVFAQLTVPFLDVGGTVEIVDFGDVDQTLDAIERGATFLSLIPWFGFQLIDAGRRRGGASNRLRVVEVGGDRVPTSYFSGFHEVFGVMPREHLGMAEANTYVVNPPAGKGLRPGSVGLPLPGVQVEVRDQLGQPEAAGAEGQIWVKSPANMVGYWEDPELTGETLQDGWVATGDLGYLDQDGYLWYTGRAKQIIICDGDNIHPKEVELEISRHPLVQQACVVGLPHPTRGETVAAAVMLRDRANDLTVAVLADFLRDRLAEVKIPETVLILDGFPETAAGKLDRDAIATAILARGERA
jgi:acyl-CoA synthetase (AMP-forming)/AMP-acid ligase II